ncbi:hypothetical protein [Microbispora amethystogenes]|uniref:Uncharacterized protein n=1 Tax=Microbispora amethystogenes TaxID=1427754 RepID=A0ABQ4F632_9ACTN|nr:hypothetical protein [Microbispora amethystogenes]GIH30245.1 hypothetical protein Mam01_04090 [Microbispora amethystogenes]
MRHPVTAPPVPERVRTLAALSAPTHVSVAGSDVPTAAARGGVDGRGRPVLLVRPGEVLYGAPAETLVTVDLSASREVGGVERPRALLKVRGWTRPVPAPPPSPSRRRAPTRTSSRPSRAVLPRWCASTSAT